METPETTTHSPTPDRNTVFHSPNRVVGEWFNFNADNTLPPTTHTRVRARARENLGGSIRAAISAVAAEHGITPYPWQMAACERLLAGVCVLAVMATNAGKSLVAYLVAAMLRDTGHGIVLAVMPLKALIADQIKHAQAFGLRAAVWNGDVSDAEKYKIADAIENGEIDILFTTAESLEGAFLRSVLQGRVYLAWIDEGHTATARKHFRISWSHIGRILDAIEPVVRFACTATSPLDQQHELIERCGLHKPQVIRESPARPNLRFIHSERTDLALVNILQHHGGQKIIIYLATVRGVESVGARLRNAGYNVAIYHGRMRPRDRLRVQTDFTNGAVPIIIATDSFGEGVNIPDIRVVICYDPAESIEAFTQQAGRAGRDGLPSTIHVCSSGSDEGWRTRRFLVETSFPPVDTIQRLHRYLNRAAGLGVRASQQQIARQAGAPNAKCHAAAIFRWLRRQGLISERREGREFTYFAQGDFNALDWSVYERERNEAMRRFHQLRALWSQPGEQIPCEIEKYFGAVTLGGTGTSTQNELPQ